MNGEKFTLTGDAPEGTDLPALITDLLGAVHSLTTHPTTVTLTGWEAQWAMQALGLGDLAAERITIDLTPAPAPASAGRR
ncbi:hypothetical protein [Deinococcus kurensis]|uniref:hypothetical protein n=1 Tax=Deinococcus kurensis TaxID=2662757 RepID=UPI0012D3376D|nr:hypothetical protein [Deinococcus kurensis]